jgi:hypothetical protein
LKPSKITFIFQFLFLFGEISPGIKQISTLSIYLLTTSRVDWLVTGHLSAQGRLDPRGAFVVSGVQTKLEPLFLTHMTHYQSLKKD